MGTRFLQQPAVKMHPQANVEFAVYSEYRPHGRNLAAIQA
jgi:hypothetical protein